MMLCGPSHVGTHKRLYADFRAPMSMLGALLKGGVSNLVIGRFYVILYRMIIPMLTCGSKGVKSFSLDACEYFKV